LTIHQLPGFISRYLPDFSPLHRIVESGICKYCHWFLRQCHQTIVPSQYCADRVYSLVEILPSVISNGVDLDRFTREATYKGEREALHQKYQLDPDLPIILHVGRLDVDKRADILLRAASRAISKIDAQLFVVGDGTQRDSLIRLSQELGIGEHSHFPGFVDANGDLPGLYRLATIFATASEIETQGLVILEAIASWLPVVAVRATCIPEIVHDTDNGFLVPPGSIDQMADRMVQLINHPQLAQEMGCISREIATHHALNKSIQKYEELYTRFSLIS
jgi:glycosyltransferase involved in cell wall biosynthesis